MLHHIVLFKFKDQLSDQEKQAFIDGLERLKTDIPVIAELSHGPNFSDRGQGFDYVLNVLLKDRDALIEYRDHPVHQNILAEVLRPASADTLAVDYEY